MQETQILVHFQKTRWFGERFFLVFCFIWTNETWISIPSYQIIEVNPNWVWIKRVWICWSVLGFCKKDSDLWTTFLFCTQRIAFWMLCMMAHWWVNSFSIKLDRNLENLYFMIRLRGPNRLVQIGQLDREFGNHKMKRNYLYSFLDDYRLSHYHKLYNF